MDLLELKEKIVTLAKSVIDNQKYKVEFDLLSKKLNISKDDLIKSIINYNIPNEEFENNEYSNILMRLTLHLHNLIEKSYHIEKGETILKYVLKNNPSSLVEIGYGAPSLYVFDRLKRNKKTTLIEQDESAEIVSKAIFEVRNINQEAVNYEVYDMNTNVSVGDYDTYVMLDSIEHTINPTEYLQQLVRNSKENANFIFTIPIMKNYNEDGSKRNKFHFEEWITTEDAEKWLSENGLEILDKKLILPNLYVDFFAFGDSPKPSYKCFAVNCKKK